MDKQTGKTECQMAAIKALREADWDSSKEKEKLEKRNPDYSLEDEERAKLNWQSRIDYDIEILEGRIRGVEEKPLKRKVRDKDVYKDNNPDFFQTRTPTGVIPQT